MELPPGTPHHLKGPATMATFAFIASASPAVPKDRTIDDVPEDVRTQCEEVYAALKANPNGRIRATFDTKAELLGFESMAKLYCDVRPAGKIRYRRSPTRGLADNIMDFRIVDVPVEAEATTEAIRDASAKAGNTAAKATPKKAAAK